ncbi:MAG: helix-turn-helix domain-containing protein [Oscillospiraceae bacterium]|nr:helix-turn-helix domain-containing protein [Oscillospiraceae bacterium]MBR4656420.1 helix-turn-helix domain-containing protein [Oscillospiraceae bacterium]
MKQRNQSGRRPGAVAPSFPVLQLREPDPLLSSREIMDYLGIGRSTLWRLYRDPEFPAFRTSAKGAWKMRQSDLDRWIRETVNRRTKSAPGPSAF